MDKELRAILREAEAQGFEVSIRKSGHVLVKKDGRTVAVFAGTPSDWRSRRNSLQRLRREGFRWPR